MPLTHSVGPSYIFSLVIFHLLHLTCSLSLLASHMSLLVSRLSLLTSRMSHRFSIVFYGGAEVYGKPVRQVRSDK